MTLPNSKPLKHPMKNILILLALILISNLAEAQFVQQRSINAQIGYGLSVPYNSVADVVDDGFFLQGEYVISPTSWFDTKAYAGFILTNSNGRDIDNNPTIEGAEAKAVLIGAKARVRAPIPWVAPYIEIGVGASIGKFETVTVFNTISENGLLYHIPFSLGLELGPNHNVDIGLAYYYHQKVEQYVGAFALGVSIPLKSK